MNTAVTTIQVLAGIYFLLGALMLNTSNGRSAFLFKVIPFTLGCALLYVAAYQNGMIGAPGTPATASLEGAKVAEYVCIEPKDNPLGDPEHCWKKMVTIEMTAAGLEPRRPPRVPCVTRTKLADVDTPGRCYLARAQIDAYRPLIGVIGAETLFEASETPIWKVNGELI